MASESKKETSSHKYRKLQTVFLWQTCLQSVSVRGDFPLHNHKGKIDLHPKRLARGRLPVFFVQDVDYLPAGVLFWNSIMSVLHHISFRTFGFTWWCLFVLFRFLCLCPADPSVTCLMCVSPFLWCTQLHTSHQRDCERCNLHYSRMYFPCRPFALNYQCVLTWFWYLQCTNGNMNNSNRRQTQVQCVVLGGFIPFRNFSVDRFVFITCSSSSHRKIPSLCILFQNYMCMKFLCERQSKGAEKRANHTCMMHNSSCHSRSCGSISCSFYPQQRLRQITLPPSPSKFCKAVVFSVTLQEYAAFNWPWKCVFWRNLHCFLVISKKSQFHWKMFRIRTARSPNKKLWKTFNVLALWFL